MNRENALRIAVEHVAKISTNARGYSDREPLAQRAEAVERFARFLVEGGELNATDETNEAAQPPAEPAPGAMYRDRDRDVWTVHEDGTLSCTGLSPYDRMAFDEANRRHGPLVRIP